MGIIALVLFHKLLLVKALLRVSEEQLGNVNVDRLIQEADLIKSVEEDSDCEWNRTVIETYEVHVDLNDGTSEIVEYVYKKPKYNVEERPFFNPEDGSSFTLHFHPLLNCYDQHDPKLLEALKQTYLYPPGSGVTIDNHHLYDLTRNKINRHY